MPVTRSQMATRMEAATTLLQLRRSMRTAARVEPVTFRTTHPRKAAAAAQKAISAIVSFESEMDA